VLISQQVAALIGASGKEIVFTSGATESNNIAIKGVAHFYKGKKNHVITTQTEHKCVLDSCRHLEQEGFEVTYLSVGTDGLVNLDELRSAIKPGTILVSVMAVNNEIGVLQPLEAIGKLCRCVCRVRSQHTSVIECVLAGQRAQGIFPLGHGSDAWEDADRRGQAQHRPGISVGSQDIWYISLELFQIRW
jgi:hypothetical protein